jgi:hypothetical protein
MANRPTQTAEDYLERIHQLIEAKGYARVVDIAESLAVREASVSNMVQRLGDQGYVNYERYRGLVLTPKGAGGCVPNPAPARDPGPFFSCWASTQRRNRETSRASSITSVRRRSTCSPTSWRFSNGGRRRWASSSRPARGRAPSRPPGSCVMARWSSSFRRPRTSGGDPGAALPSALRKAARALPVVYDRRPGPALVKDGLDADLLGLFVGDPLARRARVGAATADPPVPREPMGLRGGGPRALRGRGADDLQPRAGPLPGIGRDRSRGTRAGVGRLRPPHETRALPESCRIVTVMVGRDPDEGPRWQPVKGTSGQWRRGECNHGRPAGREGSSARPWM